MKQALNFYNKNKKELLLSFLVLLAPGLICLLALATNNIVEISWFPFWVSLFLFLLDLVCLALSANDLEKEQRDARLIHLEIWIIPVISIAVFFAFNFSIHVDQGDHTLQIPFFFLGALFCYMGNLLPKIRQNSTFGIKTTWSLESRANWRASNRFGGKCLVLSGLLFLFSGLFINTSSMDFWSINGFHLNIWLILLLSVIILAILPILYSYLYYRKEKKEGVVFEKTSQSRKAGWTGKISAGMVLVCFIFAGILLVTGSISISLGKESLQLGCTYWPQSTIDYDQIQNISYMDDLESTRTAGFGSWKLMAGNFYSPEIGDFTSYRYTDNPQSILIESDQGTFVVNESTEKETEALYKQLQQHLHAAS